MGYVKDGFAFLIDGFEPSKYKVKSFALRQKVKSKAFAFGEIECCAFGEMKSVSHPAKRDFTCEADFTAEDDFTRPQGRISLKKALATASAFFCLWGM